MDDTGEWSRLTDADGELYDPRSALESIENNSGQDGQDELWQRTHHQAAIALVRERNRELLKALGREQPHLYTELGAAFTSRREVLSARRVPKPAPRAKAKFRKKAGATEAAALVSAGGASNSAAAADGAARSNGAKVPEVKHA